MISLKYAIEFRAFGFFAFLGDLLHMPRKKISLFFIYLSFISSGSPILAELIMAFVLKLKEYVNNARVAALD